MKKRICMILALAVLLAGTVLPAAADAEGSAPGQYSGVDASKTNIRAGFGSKDKNGNIQSIQTAALAIVALAYAPVKERLFPEDGEGARILAFAAAVLLAAVMGALVRWGAHRFLRMLVGQPIDGIAGAVLAALTLSIALLMVFSFARLLPIPEVRETVFEKSVSGRVALPLVDRLVERAFRTGEDDPASAEPPPAPVSAAPAAAPAEG